MNDRDALYRAVLDNPDDDTLRLVYADALEESGDPRRAAFVRAHVELSRVPEYEQASIRARYRDKKQKSAIGRWITELPPLPRGLSWARDPFRRGMLGAIQAEDGASFVAHADGLFAGYPIESLELRNAQIADAAALAACPWLNRLRSLSLAQGAGRSTIQRLLDSEHFERLTNLHLGSQLTTPAAVTAVVRSRVFARLTGLSAREDRPGAGSLISALARLPNPPGLKKLDFSGNRLSAESLGLLVTSAAARSVEELDLNDNNLGAQGLAAIAGATLPNLRVLHLLQTGPTVEGVAALAGASYFPELRSLSLGGNHLASTAATWIAGAPAANLRVLSLHDNRVGDRGAESLANSANLAGLLVLDLAEAHIGDAGAETLAQSEHLSNLMYLNLYGNAIAPATMGRLRKRFGDRVFL